MKTDIAILMWDMLAFFLDELEYVWKGKWSFITLLYAVTRYGILVELLMQFWFPTKQLLTVTVSSLLATSVLDTNNITSARW